MTKIFCQSYLLVISLMMYIITHRVCIDDIDQSVHAISIWNNILIHVPLCIDLGNQNNNRDIFSCWISKFAYEFPCILIKYGYLFAGTCISWCFIRIIFDINVDKRDKYMNRSIFAIFLMFLCFPRPVYSSH